MLCVTCFLCYHNSCGISLTTDTQAVYYINSFGYGHGIPTLNNWRCIGNETNLNDCLKSTSSCFISYRGVYRLAGVVCKGNIVLGKNNYESFD